MAEITKEITLAEALNRVGKGKLPVRAKDGDLWAEAVVLVLKTNGKEYYALQGTNRHGNLIIKEDYEDHGIVKVINAYPTVKFKAEVDGKSLDKATREEKEKWLGKAPYPIIEKLRIKEMSDDEIDDLLVRCMRMQELDFVAMEKAERLDLPKKGGKR